MGQEAHTKQGDDRELRAASPAQAHSLRDDRMLGALARGASGPGRPAALARALAAGARLSNRAVAQMLSREGYGYGYADDPLYTGGFGPSDATIRVKPGPVRTTLLRPRTEPAAADVSSQTPQAGWDARFREMSKRIDEAGHAQAKNPLRGTGTAPIDSSYSGAFSAEFMKLQHRLSMTEVWKEVEEEAQHLLRDYAIWYVESRHGGNVPPNLRVMFDYVGRSTINNASALEAKGKYKSTKHFGGYLEKDKTPSKNWCTQTSTTAVLDAIAAMGSKMPIDKLLKQKLPGAKSITYGEEAYTAPLQPGDMVFYLFKNCQYGGHAVTVIDDLGDSFTHISGNAGDAISVAIGEAKRMKTPPSGPETFVLGKACPAPVTAAPGASDEEKAEAAKKTREKQMAATQYIKNFNFGDKFLVYSITRYGSLLAGLESPKPP
jgi:hypothetical protein